MNINGNLVQIATSQPTTATAAVAQPAVSSPNQTVVPQTITTSGNQLTMANGNLVMVRNTPDVRNISLLTNYISLNFYQDVNISF